VVLDAGVVVDGGTVLRVVVVTDLGGSVVEGRGSVVGGRVRELGTGTVVVRQKTPGQGRVAGVEAASSLVAACPWVAASADIGGAGSKASAMAPAAAAAGTHGPSVASRRRIG
jgi:hypothetical protein